jgi:hypothetical protein
MVEPQAKRKLNDFACTGMRFAGRAPEKRQTSIILEAGAEITEVVANSIGWLNRNEANDPSPQSDSTASAR